MSTPSTPPPDLVIEDESLGQHTVEVAIPNVGTFVIESEEGGYDDEVAFAQTSVLSFCALEVCACLMYGLRASSLLHMALHKLFHT